MAWKTNETGILI